MMKVLREIARGLAGVTGLVGLAGAGQAVAAPTPTECKVIAVVATKVLNAVGKDTLSIEFRQSFRDWLGPDLKCDGPKEIATPTVDDVAAFNTIRGVLLQGDQPISLQNYGVHAVTDSQSQ